MLAMLCLYVRENDHDWLLGSVVDCVANFDFHWLFSCEKIGFALLLGSGVLDNLLCCYDVLACCCAAVGRVSDPVADTQTVCTSRPLWRFYC